MSDYYITCPRCGREIPPNHMAQHKPICAKLPAVADLVKEYRAGANMSDLADKYGVGREAVTRALRHGGVTKSETRGRSAHASTGGPPRRWKCKPIERVRPCHCCGMNLDHVLVPDAGNGLCAYCALEHRQPSRDWAVRVVG